DYARRVNEMAGGRLELEVLPAGAVVGALQMQDAVNTGILDGGHGVTAYWYGKHKAYSLFGTPPSFGWQANHMLGWMKYGGGQELYDELVNDVLNLNLVGFLSGPMPNQPLGWFKQPVTSVDDFRGLKYRTVGLAADLMNEFGAAVTIMGGGDIVPAMDRGLLDAAEFNNPSSDRILGFPDVSKVYMLQSYHQASEVFEIIFNKRRYESLPEDLQAILRYAAEAASSDMSWKAMDRYPDDLALMEGEQGVQVIETPKEILEAQLAAWDTVIANLSQEPFFGRVIESQRTWVEKVISFERRNTADTAAAFEHFFSRG
nr:TRAP transporter substrate-binding protein [Deinococcota bacterium]